MSLIIKSFLSLPLLGRVTILLFFLIFVFWRVFGRKMLWLLSFLPFFLGKIFLYLYLLVEIPVAALHKKFGTSFYKIDNKLSQFGEKIDSAIRRWYDAWHCPQKFHLGKSLLIYVLCVVFIALPSLMKVEINALKTGETAYLYCEASLVRWFEEFSWYDPAKPTSLFQGTQSKHKPVVMKLIVSGINSSLLVRDIPSTENSAALDRLYNGDTVVWSGQLVFSEVDNGHVEPWVKVVTPNGIEGWSRLFYLHPEQYVDIEFYVVK